MLQKRSSMERKRLGIIGFPSWWRDPLRLSNSQEIPDGVQRQPELRRGQPPHRIGETPRSSPQEARPDLRGHPAVVEIPVAGAAYGGRQRCTGSPRLRDVCPAPHDMVPVWLYAKFPFPAGFAGVPRAPEDEPTLAGLPRGPARRPGALRAERSPTNHGAPSLPPWAPSVPPRPRAPALRRGLACALRPRRPLAGGPACGGSGRARRPTSSAPLRRPA